MQGKVIDIIAKVLGVDVNTVNADSSPASIEAWDSLKHITVILAVEEAFGVHFSYDQVTELDGVGKIIEAVKALKSKE